MNKKWSAIGLVGVLTMSGCAFISPAPEKKLEFTDSDAVTVVVPKKLDGSKKVLSKIEGLSFERIVNDRYGPARYTNTWDVEEGDFKVRRFVCGWATGSCNPLKKASITVEGSLAFSGTDDNTQLVVTPKTYKHDSTRDLVGGTLHFSWLNLNAKQLKDSLSELTYSWKFEMDSTYSSEAVYANFQRLTRAEKYSSGYKDRGTEKILKNRFWVTVDSVEIPVTLEAYPYRSGSKAVVNAELKPIVEGNTLDFAKTVKLLEARVAEIVKS